MSIQKKCDEIHQLVNSFNGDREEYRKISAKIGECLTEIHKLKHQAMGTSSPEMFGKVAKASYLECKCNKMYKHIYHKMEGSSKSNSPRQGKRKNVFVPQEIQFGRGDATHRPSNMHVVQYQNNGMNFLSIRESDVMSGGGMDNHVTHEEALEWMQVQVGGDDDWENDEIDWDEVAMAGGADERKELLYFYYDTCPHCQRQNKILGNRTDIDGVPIVKIDVKSPKGQEMVKKYSKIVAEGVPAFLLNYPDSTVRTASPRFGTAEIDVLRNYVNQ